MSYYSLLPVLLFFFYLSFYLSFHLSSFKSTWGIILQDIRLAEMDQIIDAAMASIDRGKLRSIPPHNIVYFVHYFRVALFSPYEPISSRGISLLTDS